MSELSERLREEAVRLSGHSIDRGSVEAGIASNLADQAADALDTKDQLLGEMREALEAMVDEFACRDASCDVGCAEARAILAKLDQREAAS